MPDPIPTTDAYDQPGAYDIICARGTAAEVVGYLRIAAQFLNASGRSLEPRHALWLEPGSGTGRLLRALAKRGGPCVGLEISPAMIDYARRSFARAGLSRHAQILNHDMRRMGTPPVRAALARVRRGTRSRPIVALCPHNSVRHLLTDADMHAHLSSMRRLITRAPRGIYIVGMGLVRSGGEPACETVFAGVRGSVRVREVINFMPPDPADRGRSVRLERAYRYLSVRTPSAEREYLSTYTLRTYSLKQWRAMLRSANLRELAVLDERGRAVDPDWTGYALRVLAAQ